jgi:hypothetical protein
LIICAIQHVTRHEDKHSYSKTVLLEVLDVTYRMIDWKK